MKVRCREGYREGYSKMVRERSERRLKSKNLDSLSPGWHEDGGAGPGAPHHRDGDVPRNGYDLLA
jgi:hypothetical protein